MTFYGFVMMALGVSLSLLVKHQQKKLEDLKNRLCSESGLASASADGFLRSYKDLLSTGDITGLYVLHNHTKDLYYVGQSAGVIARAAAQLLGRVTRTSMRTTSMVTISAFGSFRSRGAGIPI